MTRTGNTAFPHLEAFSIDENGTLIPERVSNAPSIPEPPKLNVVEYRYEHDRYGNWTEQTVVRRSESNEYSNVRHPHAHVLLIPSSLVYFTYLLYNL